MAAAKPALVGAFVLSGIALMVCAVLLLAGTQLFSRKLHAVTYFESSVSGLAVGSPVTMRGVRVGSVSSIGLVVDTRDLTARIPVHLDIEPDHIVFSGSEDHDPQRLLDRALKAGLQAQLDMDNLLSGQLRVDLDIRPGVRSTTLGGNLEPNEIPSSRSKLQTLEAEVADLPLGEIADNANQTLLSVKRVTDALGPRVGPMVDSLRRTSESAHTTLRTADGALGHIDDLAVAGKRQLGSSGADLDRVLTSADQTVRDADALVASLQEMTARNSQMRQDLQSATRDLAASASSLRTFSHEIERNPSDLIRRGKPP